MNDPSTFWLTFVNVALGVVVLICCLAVAYGVLQELAARHRKRAEQSDLDREMAHLVASYDQHTFQIPELGVTMADGGEELREKEKR